MGGNLSHFRCLACWVLEFDYKSLFNTGLGVRVRLIGVCLIKVSSKVNKGNKFGTWATVRLIEVSA